VAGAALHKEQADPTSISSPPKTRFCQRMASGLRIQRRSALALPA
jgi:hypothetical protein